MPISSANSVVTQVCRNSPSVPLPGPSAGGCLLAGSSLLSAHNGKSSSAGHADTAQLLHILMVFTKYFSVLDISIYYSFSMNMADMLYFLF